MLPVVVSLLGSASDPRTWEKLKTEPAHALSCLTIYLPHAASVLVIGSADTGI